MSINNKEITSMLFEKAAKIAWEKLVVRLVPQTAIENGVRYLTFKLWCQDCLSEELCDEILTEKELVEMLLKEDRLENPVKLSPAPSNHGSPTYN